MFYGVTLREATRCGSASSLHNESSFVIKAMSFDDAMKKAAASAAAIESHKDVQTQSPAATWGVYPKVERGFRCARTALQWEGIEDALLERELEQRGMACPEGCTHEDVGEAPPHPAWMLPPDEGE